MPPPQTQLPTSQSSEGSQIKSEAVLPTHSTPQKSQIVQNHGTLPNSSGFSNTPAASPYPLGASPNPQSGTPYSPVSTPNYNRPSAHVPPNQHSVISVDEGTSVRGQDKLSFGGILQLGIDSLNINNFQLLKFIIFCKIPTGRSQNMKRNGGKNFEPVHIFFPDMKPSIEYLDYSKFPIFTPSP